MSEFGRLKSIGVSMAVAVCMLALVGCPPSGVPVITGADRDEVPATIPTELTITGTGFAQGAVVIFGTDELGTIATVPASSVAADGTSLTVTTPVVDIDEDTPINYCVQNPSGRVSEHVDILFAAPPDLASVFPTEIPAQVPTQIAISGDNLDAGAEVCFLANTGEFGCDTLSAGQTVDTAALSGTVGPTLVSVKITNLDGQMDVLTGALLYEAAPTVLQVMPAEVPATIPTDIMILGRGFDNGATVRFVDSAGNVLGTDFFELDCQGQCAETQKLAGKSPEVTGLADDECIYVQVVFANGTSTEPGEGQPTPIVKALGELCLIAPPQIAQATVSPESVPAATVDAEVTLAGSNLREGSEIVARVPAHSHLAFGNGIGCGGSVPEIPDFPYVKQDGEFPEGSDCGEEVVIPADEVEFMALLDGGELTFVRPPIEDNPSTPQFEGVQQAVQVELAVRDEWGQESEDVVTVQYNTSPRILGVSPLVIPATVPITFVATLNNISLDGNGAGDLEFFWWDGSQGELGPSIGVPSASLWQELIDPNAPADPDPNAPDPLSPTVAVRAVTPQYFEPFPSAMNNIAAVVTNNDGQQAIYPLTLSGEAEILRVYNADTGFAEVAATYGFGPEYYDAKNIGFEGLPEFITDRTVIIEGFELGSGYVPGDLVEVRFSRHADQQDPDPDLDHDGTLLDIVPGMVSTSPLGGVHMITCQAPTFPCGALLEDELIQVRVMREDGQGTRESAVGVINYKAQPILTFAETTPNEGAVHGLNQFPATIPTIFTIEAENLASSLYLGKPREQVGFFVPADDEAEVPDFVDVHFATVPFTTGSADPRQTPLVGVQLLSSPAIGEPDTAQGRTPAIFGLTEHTDITLIAYDKYGQASIEAIEDCGPYAPVTLEALAPPQLSSFLVTAENCAGEDVTLPSVAPGTDLVEATFEIVGDLFTPGITAKFYRNSVFDSDLGIWVGEGEPFAEIPADDLGGNFDDSLTGTVPPLLGPDEDTELNVSIVLCAQDQQMSEAFRGIKYVGLPVVTKVRVAGTDDETTGDPGDSYFVTNGPLRNSLDNPGFATLFEVVGRNLDCRSPVTGEGEIELTLNAGATTAQVQIPNSIPVLGAPAPQNMGSLTQDVTEAVIEFGITDMSETIMLNGIEIDTMTDSFGALDLTICDCVGQTTQHAEVLATIIGPSATGQGNAAGVATGDVDGDDIDDIVFITAANPFESGIPQFASTKAMYDMYSQYTAIVNVYLGVEINQATKQIGERSLIPFEPAYEFPIATDPNFQALGIPEEALQAYTPSVQRIAVADFTGDGTADIAVGFPDRNFDEEEVTQSLTGTGSPGLVAYFRTSGNAGNLTINDPIYFVGGDPQDPASSRLGFGTSLAAGNITASGSGAVDPEDLVVSAPGYPADAQGNALNQGAAFVYFGRDSFAGGTTSPGNDATLLADTPQNGELLGLGLDVGNFNSDANEVGPHFDDVFLGAPNFDLPSVQPGNPYQQVGRVYQFNGSADFNETRDAIYVPSPGPQVAGFQAGHVSVGDYDGDGFADLLVGRPGLGLIQSNPAGGDPIDTRRVYGDVALFLGGASSPTNPSDIMTLMAANSYIVAYSGVGYSGAMEVVGAPNDGVPSALLGGPAAVGTLENPTVNNALDVFLSQDILEPTVPSDSDPGVPDDTRAYNGIVQGFMGSVISNLIVGPDTRETILQGGYLGVTPLPTRYFGIESGLYGQLVEAADVFPDGTGREDFFIVFPGLGGEFGEEGYYYGGGLVIVPQGHDFDAAHVHDRTIIP